MTGRLKWLEAYIGDSASRLTAVHTAPPLRGRARDGGIAPPRDPRTQKHRSRAPLPCAGRRRTFHHVHPLASSPLPPRARSRRRLLVALAAHAAHPRPPPGVHSLGVAPRDRGLRHRLRPHRLTAVDEGGGHRRPRAPHAPRARGRVALGKRERGSRAALVRRRPRAARGERRRGALGRQRQRHLYVARASRSRVAARGPVAAGALRVARRVRGGLAVD
jgi:hypothetical protein